MLEIGSSGLTDLDGIGALQSLTELRVPNNELTLCSPLVMCAGIKVWHLRHYFWGISRVFPAPCHPSRRVTYSTLYLSLLDADWCLQSDVMHDSRLQMLDLSSNRIADPEQLEYLGLCPALEMLVLENNPVCTEQPDEETYKNLIRAAVPKLRELDGVSLVGGADSAASTGNEAVEPRRPSGGSLRRPHTAAPVRAGRPGTASAARATRSPGGSASSLTHGSTQLFQGSPLKALRARRANSGGDSLGDSLGVSPRGSMSSFQGFEVAADVWRPGDDDAAADGEDNVFAPDAEAKPSELDALLMSVGMAPVDSVADDEATGLADQDVNSVLADLKAWRTGFATGWVAFPHLCCPRDLPVWWWRCACCSRRPLVRAAFGGKARPV